MTGRRRDLSGPSPATPGPSRRQAIALLAVLVLVTGVVTVLSYLVPPDRARAFDLFHGSVFLSDQLGPVAADLASGRATLRLVNADQQVGVSGSQILDAVPLTDDTLLLNPSTGEFNMVDNNGFVVKHDGSGVPLADRTGRTTATGIDAGSGLAYIVRTGPQGGTDVYLVSQSTVEAAASGTPHVQPRASGSMPGETSTASGAAASANGDLWLLVGPADGLRTVRQLRVPAGSSSGATLVASEHSQVFGPAAIGTAGAGEPGRAVVGVASVSRIDIFRPGSAPRIAGYAAPAGVDRVLPTTNAQSRLGFLLHGSAGWYLVSVGANGSDLRAPTLLTKLPQDADLATPAASNGSMYTIDRATGALYSIGYDAGVQRLAGRQSYPAFRAEAAGYADAYVLGRGPRVVFNSPTHLNALMVFTDASSTPRVIPKASAVLVDAAGGAEALTRSNVPAPAPKPPKPGTPKPRPVDVEPVNPRLNCHASAVTPHIPAITSVVPGSRTVSLSWHYPVLSPQDCIPSTYVVSFTLLSSDAPQPPQSVSVQAQTGVTVSGLFPGTVYQATVTALIHGQGTASLPARFTTGEEGPKAPTGLTVSADSSGDWQLHWDSCGSIEQGCVATQSWTVTPSYCDGRGVSAPPAPITVTADPTSKRQPPTVYRGSDDLLGRGLRFQVQGTGSEGQAGTPSAPSPCVYSWSTPVAGDLTIQASTPPPTAGANDTTATTVRVSFAGSRVHDLGGLGGTLTYQLLSGGTVVSTLGPTTAASVQLSGIRAGARYQVQVVASPPRHPEISVPVGPVDVVPAIADWPALLVGQPSFDAPPGATGTLHVRFDFPAGTDTRGETFQLVNSQLVCGGGNSAMELQAGNVTPGEDLTFPVDRTIYRGPCSVSLQLAQDPATATDPPLYGAGTSQAATSPSVQIDPPSITATAGDFQAQWGGTTGNPTIILSYSGADDLADGARDWDMTVSRGGDNCGELTATPPPATIDVDKSCIASGSGPFSVHVTYTYFGVADAAFDVPVSGDAPSPVDPSQLSFAAHWNADPAQPEIVVDYTGSAPSASLQPLQWTETVTSSALPGVTCAVQHDNPADGPVRIDNVLATCPATPTLTGALPTYSVDISFTDPNYGRTGDYPVTVDGSPPT